jgi:hypothetical protein
MLKCSQKSVLTSHPHSTIFILHLLMHQFRFRPSLCSVHGLVSLSQLSIQPRIHILNQNWHSRSQNSPPWIDILTHGVKVHFHKCWIRHIVRIHTYRL